MKNVFVAGGAGVVGEVIVRALLASPDVAAVAASSRDEARLEALHARLGSTAARLVPLAGDAGDPQGAAELARRAIDLWGHVDVAIASLGAGSIAPAPLLEADAATWYRSLHDMLGTHFFFARAFLPVLAQRPGALF